MKKHAWYSRRGVAPGRSNVFRLLAASGLAVAAAASTEMPPAHAATAAATSSPTVTACAISGSVTVTIAGITNTAPIGCLNKATQSTPGSTDQAAADVSVPSLLGLDNLGNIQGPDSQAQYASSAGGVTLSGATKATNVQLVQSLVSAQNVNESLTCTFANGSTAPTCQAPGTTIGNLTLGGQAQMVPTPIPVNYTLPLQSNITLKVAGLLPITVPVDGTIVLNEMKTTGTGNATQTQHALMHVSLSGKGEAGGTGAVEVKVDLVDVVWMCDGSSPC